MEHDRRQPPSQHPRSQDGQSIVLIAFLLIGMLAFVGLAVDIGFIWVRNAQLSRAVDAAALAGATELGITRFITNADEKARQFLLVNDLPPVAVNSLNSSEAINLLGATEYSITVTWPVQLFFLRLLNFTSVDLEQEATAAYFPLVDLYASRRVDDGILSTSTQSVFGPQICTRFGDPFTPFTTDDLGTPNPWRTDFSSLYSYRYRIGIPSTYEADNGTSIVRIELFDPDSINAPATSQFQIVHTLAYSNVNNLGANFIEGPFTCAQFNPTDTRVNTCIVETCEYAGQTNGPNACAGRTQISNLDQINPFWFMRVDENRGQGAPPGNGQCGTTPPAVYTPGFNTQTEFNLRYFRRQPDGTLENVTLATYTAQVADGFRDHDAWSHQTDINWVSPGGYNSVGPVPTDCASPLGGYSLPGDDANGDGLDDAGTRCAGEPHRPINEAQNDPSGFEIDLSTDVPNILVDSVSGQRFIYLDVTALSGSSENDYELWAGPPHYNLPANANLRNVYKLNRPGQFSSGGATVFAIGILPMNSIFQNSVDIPLLYIGPEYAGEVLSISLFDPDSGTVPPITFYFDTIAEDDYKVVFNTNGCWGTSGCNIRWVGPPGTGVDDTPFLIPVPDLDAVACAATNNPVDCTPFYGGRLMLRYQAGEGDTYRWVVNLPTRPFLVR